MESLIRTMLGLAGERATEIFGDTTVCVSTGGARRWLIFTCDTCHTENGILAGSTITCAHCKSAKEISGNLMNQYIKRFFIFSLSVIYVDDTLLRWTGKVLRNFDRNSHEQHLADVRTMIAEIISINA